MPKTHFPNGMSIHTYESPPAKFNPLTASNRQLLKYGFPTRPDPKKEPELYKLWKSAVSNNLTLVPPTFILKETHKLIGENIEAGTSANWSGSVVSVPNVGNSFQWIMGRWTIPNYIQPPRPENRQQEAVSVWIGIDDTLRVGIEWGWLWPQPSQGPLVNIEPAWLNITVWWEWQYEDDIYRQDLKTFPAGPGDVIWGALCVNSNTSATIGLSHLNFDA